MIWIVDNMKKTSLICCEAMDVFPYQVFLHPIDRKLFLDALLF